MNLNKASQYKIVPKHKIESVFKYLQDLSRSTNLIDLRPSEKIIEIKYKVVYAPEETTEGKETSYLITTSSAKNGIEIALINVVSYSTREYLYWASISQDCLNEVRNINLDALKVLYGES